VHRKLSAPVHKVVFAQTQVPATPSANAFAKTDLSAKHAKMKYRCHARAMPVVLNAPGSERAACQQGIVYAQQPMKVMLVKLFARARRDLTDKNAVELVRVMAWGAVAPQASVRV
jgi:hypothetical protein